MINNTALIVGTVLSEPQYDHSVMDEKFFLIYISSLRKSGVPDELPVIISEKLINLNVEYLGLRVEVTGSFRSYNLHIKGINHKRMYIFADSITKTDQEDSNKISLTGYLCKDAVYRETPMGRKISDLCMAVHRNINKSDYIPVLLWGRNAIVIRNMPVGILLNIVGRIQCRWYQKQLEDGTTEDRCCYEVSAYWMDKLCSGGVDDAEYGSQDREQGQVLQ